MTEIIKSTWDLLRETIKSGDTDKALELLERGLNRAAMQHDSLVSFVGMAVTHLARFGDEELEKLYRERYTSKAQEWINTAPGVKESVERCAEIMESPYSKITIAEEPDRYVLSLDPCRSGGRLMRSMSDGSAKFDSASIGTIKKSYPWTWGKSGVCCYCPHSSLLFEIIPIELRGYPIAVLEYPEKPEDPCVFLFYKKPELIPEEYFTRIGKTNRQQKV